MCYAWCHSSTVHVVCTSWRNPLLCCGFIAEYKHTQHVPCSLLFITYNHWWCDKCTVLDQKCSPNTFTCPKSRSSLLNSYRDLPLGAFIHSIVNSSRRCFSCIDAKVKRVQYFICWKSSTAYKLLRCIWV